MNNLNKGTVDEIVNLDNVEYILVFDKGNETPKRISKANFDADVASKPALTTDSITPRTPEAPVRIVGDLQVTGALSQTTSLKYRAFVTQIGTNAPTAVIETNELSGTPVWGYSTTGTYTLTLAGAFPEGNTQVISMQWYDNTEDDYAYFYTRIDPSDSGNLITFYTFNNVVTGLYNNTFNNTPVEITVYSI